MQTLGRLGNSAPPVFQTLLSVFAAVKKTSSFPRVLLPVLISLSSITNKPPLLFAAIGRVSSQVRNSARSRVLGGLPLSQTAGFAPICKLQGGATPEIG